ncbi:19717_t:CDS:2 [Racocetra fulgida]|uniref:19717_t:CDS:1 n=1 Tax=Racocetra fulgida TaxID=60492 RepID=A0A9N8ZJW5_9GLOM|nr:19717_t:CDS:2 [Racocetra fulgida]
METNKEIDITVLRDNNDLDIPRLNKYYRSAWRSLELDNSKLDQRCDFLQNKFKNDKSFNESEKTYLLTKLGEYQEKFNLINKAGKSRRCDDCHNLTYSIQNSSAIVKGMRPKIDLNIPQKYATLMEQCWNATPENRPDVLTVWKKIRELRMKLIEAKDNGMLEEDFLGINPSSTKLVKDKIVSRRCFSGLHTLTNISEPKNASREESEDELDNESESNSSCQLF